MFRILKCEKLHSFLKACRFSTQSEIYIKDMKYLNVAEKNEAAKTIASLLSRGSAKRRDGYSVYNKIYEFDTLVKGKQCKMIMTSVSGHLLEASFLPAYRNWRNVDPQSLFDAPIRKTCKQEFEPIKRTLEREIRNCQGLIIWTDCDREGENIGMEIVDVCRAIKPNIIIHRAVFSEITTGAVQRALQQLKTLDKRASDAVDVRTELDLRTGASITRFQTMRLQRLFPQNIADKLISYGSCQIPTLGFVAERYKEIEAFVSEPFWRIKVLHTIDDLTVEFNWARHRLFNQTECENYYLICVADPLATVESVIVKPKSKWRPQPMDTVELEKLASRKLKLSAKETMTIAEKLYTKGCISYPRTETNQFSKEIDLRNLVEQQIPHPAWGDFARRIIEWGTNPRNGNKSDQAHPPIHPTKLITNLDANEARVYELVCRHFLACVSKDATGMETIVNINIAGEKFSATGLCIHERNYLDVYIYDKWNAKLIHKYEQNQQFEPTDISMPEGATTAPPLLTEADLIALMEKHGIGTDATHAEHINTIKERGYIGVIDKGFLIPGVIGMALYEGYNEVQLALAKPHLRAEFEEDLKKICNGQKDPKVVLREQIVKYKEAYKQIMDNITAMDAKISQRLNETPNSNGDGSSSNNLENSSDRVQELFKCPKCQEASLGLKKKKNQAGHFIGCLNFPNCKNIVWWPDACQEPHVLDEFCNKCGNSVKLIKFKFQNHIHKTQFNAPYGWYKTCLICDALFRNTFEINLENIKCTGRIVGEVSSRPNTITPLGSNNINESDRNRAPAGRNNQNQPKKPKLSTVNRKKASTSIGNTRNIFTMGSNNSEQRSIDAIVSGELNSAVVEEFFASNDSFESAALIPGASSETANLNLEDVFMEDNDFDLPEIQASNLDMRPSIINHPTVSRPNNEEEYDIYSMSSLNDNFLNDLNRSWGSSGIKSTSNPSTSNNAPVNYIKCTGCHQNAKGSIVRKEGPNKGRPFYSCPKNPPCKFFQWADEAVRSEQSSSRDTPRSTIAINCRCDKEAKSLIVRKEGPNKGREFYACANRDKSCGFFQWVDDSNNQGTTSSAVQTNDSWGSGSSSSVVHTNDSWGSTSNSLNDTWGTSRNNLIRGFSRNQNTSSTSREAKKRKCGLCRQFGHTRSKCPHSAQYNM